MENPARKSLFSSTMPKTAMYGSDKLCTMDLDYKLLKQALIDFYKPENPVEEVLVERIAVLDWRLKRNVLAERKVVNIRPGKEAYLPPAEAFDRILKYDRTADRELHRAISALEQIREKKEKSEERKERKSASSRSDGDDTAPITDPQKEPYGSEKGPQGLKKEPYDPANIPNIESALDALFSSSIRVKVLKLFLKEEQDRFYLREISAKLGAWHGPVQREIDKLTDAGVLSKEISGRQAYYRINDNCPFIFGLRSIFSVTAIQQGIKSSKSEASVKQG